MRQERHRHPFRHRVEQRHRDRGALAGAVARDQRFQDRLIGIHAGADIGDRKADPRRRIRPAGDGGKPGLRLHQQVIGLARGIGAALAVTRDRAADQPRMLLAQFRDRKAELGDRAGLQVLHEHVGLREQRREQRAVLALAEIEHDRFLAAIEPDEIRALAMHMIVVMAREVALRPLDLDHARAGIGEPAGRLRRRHRLFERDHEDAGEGEGHGHLKLGRPRESGDPEPGTGSLLARG